MFDHKPLSAGLYLVATPIGAARDITLRGLDTLANADVIAAEDTRTARKLMDIHAIALRDRPLVAYHDHSKENVRRKLIAMMADGKALAYVSEAGTPLVADPGYVLTRETIDAGLPVTTAPGPSAMIAALTISGLPSDRFMFAGFSPNTRSARQKFLLEFKETAATLIFYESPKRLGAFLADATQVFGARDGAVCREVTKKFEEVLRAPLDQLAERIAQHPVRGEVVVLIDRARAEAVSPEMMKDALKDALVSMTVKDAAAVVAEALGLPKRVVYQAALELNKKP